MTRRPIGCRPNTPAEDAARDTADYRTFEYREDAAAAAAKYARWHAYPRYAGWLDLWTVMARPTPTTHGIVRILRTDGRLR